MAGGGRARTRGLARWAPVAILLAFAALLRAGSQAAAVEDLSPAERNEAAQLYSVHCARCHGANGQGAIVPGTDRSAPAIDEAPVALMDLVVRTGRMPPPEGDPWDNRRRSQALDARQRQLLVSYLQEQLGLPGEIPEAMLGDPARGRVVYEINCAACHGSVGGGGVAGGGAFTPRISGYDPVTLGEAIRTGPFQMPSFAETQISDDEIGDLAAFLEEIEREQGTVVLGLIELNPVFASGFAAVFSLVVILSLVWIAGRPARFRDPDAQERE